MIFKGILQGRKKKTKTHKKPILRFIVVGKTEWAADLETHDRGKQWTDVPWGDEPDEERSWRAVLKTLTWFRGGHNSSQTSFTVLEGCL